MPKGRDPDRGSNEKFVSFMDDPLCNVNGCGIAKVKSPAGATAKKSLPVLLCPECDGHALKMAQREQ